MALFLMLMGPQGAGKGVQARRLSARLGIPHVSTGDLFRAMREREDELAREVQAIMAAGHLVNDELTNEILRDRLEQPDAQAGAVLDGYPRNFNQVDYLEKYLAGRGDRLNAVLLLGLDLFEAFRRTYGRITATDGRSFNIYSNDEGVDWQFEDHPERAYPPRLRALLRESGEELKRRPDDAHAHAIILRIEAYLAETAELVAHFEERDLLRRIDASQDIEAVTEDILRHAKERADIPLAAAVT